MIGILEGVSRVTHCMAEPRSYASSMGTYGPATTTRVAAHAMRKLEEARRLDVEAHERNVPILAAHRAIHERVHALMEELCVPLTYRRQVQGSRARTPRMETVDAGFVQDLKRLFPLSDGFQASTETYNSMKVKYDAFVVFADAEAGQRAQAAALDVEAKRAARRKDLKLAEILLRYGFCIDSDWGDILAALRERDQRADLAVAMRMTRGDWSEGFHRVTDALGRFTVRTVEDAEIQTDILSCFTDQDDGRVFRDTVWNYDRLFASIKDRQLVADIEACLENRGDD